MERNISLCPGQQQSNSCLAGLELCLHILTCPFVNPARGPLINTTSSRSCLVSDPLRRTRFLRVSGWTAPEQQGAERGFHFILFFWPNFPWVQASTATWVDSPRRTQVMPPSSQLVVTMVGTAACIKKGRKEGRKSPKL